MRALAPPVAKSADKELAKLQTFVLDALGPVTCMLEHAERLSIEDIRDASSATATLIGNANAHLSRLRREKFVTSINKNLSPLVKEDVGFTSAAPNLFGADFSKRAKEYLDQVKSLRPRQLLPSRSYSGYSQGYKKPLFRKGFSSGRGMAKGRGGAPSNFKGNRGEKSRQQ